MKLAMAQMPMTSDIADNLKTSLEYCDAAVYRARKPYLGTRRPEMYL